MAGEYRWHLIDDFLEKEKKRLVDLLGGLCVVCQESDISLLEFHHRNGKNWRSRSLSRSQRLKRYEQDILDGEVYLLCDTCHNDPSEHPDDCFCPFCRERVDF